MDEVWVYAVGLIGGLVVVVVCTYGISLCVDKCCPSSTAAAEAPLNERSPYLIDDHHDDATEEIIFDEDQDYEDNQERNPRSSRYREQTPIISDFWKCSGFCCLAIVLIIAIIFGLSWGLNQRASNKQTGSTPTQRQCRDSPYSGYYGDDSYKCSFLVTEATSFADGIRQQLQYDAGIPTLSIQNPRNRFNVNGTVPTDIGLFHNLRELYLDGNIFYESNGEQNMLQGPLPSQLGLLADSLESLGISNAAISGTLPTGLGLLTKLTYLDLGYMPNLTGSIPTTIERLTWLRNFRIYSAGRLQGSIPTQVARTSNLRTLELYNNSISSRIPSELGQLTHLSALDLSNNKLSSRIPSELGRLTSLYFCDLGHNMLSGRVPSELGRLLRVWKVGMANNSLTGQIPWQLESIGTRQIQGSSAYRPSPAIVSLLDNPLSGSLPIQFCRRPSGTITVRMDNNIDNNSSSQGEDSNPADNFVMPMPSKFCARWWDNHDDRQRLLPDVQVNCTVVACECPCPYPSNESLNNVQSYLIANNVSKEQDLSLHHSPQNWALQIMAHELDYTRSGLKMPQSDKDSPDGYYFVTRYILRILYFSTLGSLWHDTRLDGSLFFDTQGSHCMWHSIQLRYDYGVYCDSEEKVTSLVLYEQNMAGTLPEELHLLSSLQSISLQSNSLRGSFPSLMISRLPSLQYLDLSSNLFSSQLSDLIGNATTQTHWNADRLGTSTAASPHRELRHLDLSNNQLLGPLEEAFVDHMNNLEVLDLSSNFLTGELPPGIFGLPLLEFIDLHNNSFTRMPSKLQTNTQLRKLALQENSLDDTIPQDIFMLQALDHLDLSSNRFKGQIPSTLGKLTNLTYLFLAENSFDAGPFPTWLEQLTELELLSLKSCSLTGTLPIPFAQSWPDIVLLDLDDNSLSGSIPAIWGRGMEGSQLRFLLLSRNEFTSIDAGGISGHLELLLLNGNNMTNGTLLFNQLYSHYFDLNTWIVGNCALCNASCPEDINCCDYCCWREDNLKDGGCTNATAAPRPAVDVPLWEQHVILSHEEWVFVEDG